MRRRAPVSRGARIALALFVAAALTLAAVVAVQGRVAVALGPVDLRTANPTRPLLAATAGALVLLGRRRAALGVLGLALVASEVGREYGRALEHAAIRSRPLGAFVACVAAQSGGEERRIRVSVGRPLSRDERYYFGRIGWRESAELDPDHVSRRVRDAERDTPLVLDYPRYRALLPSMADWPAPVLQSLSQAPLRGHDLLVLLPGRFRPCALATGGAS